MPKFIVIVGGVISGVGKGITTASIGRILKNHGHTVNVLKIDPYINIDAGTLRPSEHGEVWVTSDGGEIDQDFGTYERFLDQKIPKINSITTGQAYQAVINKERQGFYNGETVQLIPHVTNEIKERILNVANQADVTLIEIGGVVGDYENTPFLFAIKSLESIYDKSDILYILVTYLPIPSHISEMKTKPTQTAIRALTESGIVPDLIICRSKDDIDDARKKKIETYVNIKKEYIISAPDCASIYQVPLNMEKQNLSNLIFNKLNLKSLKKPDWSSWNNLVDLIVKPSHQRLKIAVIGKYLKSGNYEINDVYVSIKEALIHAAAHQSQSLDIQWINSMDIEKGTYAIDQLSNFQGILIPGGFGSSGIEGKIMAIKFAREHCIPFFGICYGMQLAAIEFARNVLNLTEANSTEINPNTKVPIINLMEEQKSVTQLGGSMRLGEYKCNLSETSLIYDLYLQYGRLNLNDGTVIERHRHRYEINPDYRNMLVDAGLYSSGVYYSDKYRVLLTEFLELSTSVHPFFVAAQAHPEFTSSLMSPNPLFMGFIKAALQTIN